MPASAPNSAKSSSSEVIVSPSSCVRFPYMISL